ncbi:MAG: adenine phosphoribosyltransferase [Bacteroidaceae bacterium]|nr:adenine phosphoribosyltransferase [Bacteroidaceae bacterium]
MNNPILLKNLRVIPDFPIPGIQFQDITTLFDNPECLHIMRDEIVDLYKDKGITKVVGLESRGFPLGGLLASELNAGFVMARKPKKLPGEVVELEYEKEYGTDKICMQAGAINENDVILIHDDLLATGGSMKAALELVRLFKPKKIYINFIIELTIEGLHGRDVFDDDVELTALLKIEE